MSAEKLKDIKVHRCMSYMLVYRPQKYAHGHGYWHLYWFVGLVKYHSMESRHIAISYHNII